jgi:hypothetical protein
MCMGTYLHQYVYDKVTTSNKILLNKSCGTLMSGNTCAMESWLLPFSEALAPQKYTLYQVTSNCIICVSFLLHQNVSQLAYHMFATEN